MTPIEQAAPDVAAMQARIAELENERDDWIACHAKVFRELQGAKQIVGNQAERIAELERQLDDSKADTYTESQYSSQQVRANVALLTKVDRLERVQGVLVVALEGLLRDVQDLMAGSEGVTGLHLNGDVAPWSELDEGGRFERLSHMSEAVSALSQVHKPAQSVEEWVDTNVSGNPQLVQAMKNIAVQQPEGATSEPRT